jgi:alkyl hydroperoxide reductase 1
VAVPGAFTPTCQEQHITSYLSHLGDLKAKGVDSVIFIASNDAFVMSAWGKANGIKDDSIVCFIPSLLTPRLHPPLTPYRGFTIPFVMCMTGLRMLTVSSQLFMSDANAEFSRSIGWASADRTGRYAVVVDHGKVVYAEADTQRGSIAHSGAEGVLAKL